MRLCYFGNWVVAAIWVSVVVLPRPDAAALMQRRVDRTNFQAFFDELERKGVYLELTERGALKERVIFLGEISKSTTRANSLANKYGGCGSKYSNTSPFNKHALNPPKIVYKQGSKAHIVGYLTKNSTTLATMLFRTLIRPTCSYGSGAWTTCQTKPCFRLMWLSPLAQAPPPRASARGASLWCK